jgi:uncharacterized protein
MRRSHVLGLLVLASFALPAQAQQQPAEPGKGSILTVRGVGRIEMKPDHARLFGTVSTKAPTLDEAAKAHRDRATHALSALQGLAAEGIEIEESTFRLNQDQPPYPAPAVLRPEAKAATPPFTAQTSFFVRIKAVDNLNPVISKLAASGLFELSSVRFGVEQERAALNQARRRAMADARDQAAAYADAADVRLVEIVAITDGEAAPSLGGAADMPIPRYVQIIPPLTVAFDSSVQVTWRIAPR